MRLSSVFVSLALLFCLSSVSAQSLIEGTWSNAYSSKDVSTYCCIPTSVEVKCSGSSSCTAYYKYPSSINSKCWNLFLSQSSGNMKLYYQGSEYYYSETTFFGHMNFNFYASNSTGSPKLNIYSTSSSSYDQCDFTMYSRVAPASGNGIGGIIALIVIILIIGTCCGANKYKNRAPVIVAQNLTQQPTIVTTYGAPTVYTAPSNVVVTQGYVQQPQIVTYTAPNQFPNTQVNMNYPGYN